MVLTTIGYLEAEALGADSGTFDRCGERAE